MSGEWVSGNIFIRAMGGPHGLPPGHVVHGHCHNFDHTSIFFGGLWQVRRWYPAVNEAGTQLRTGNNEPAWVLMDDFEREGPFHVLIDGNCKHEFTFKGFPLPAWMEAFMIDMTPERETAFRAKYAETQGKAWCVYSHRTAQGDISQVETGFYKAYQ